MPLPLIIEFNPGAPDLLRLFTHWYEECPLSTWMVVEDEPDIYEVLLAMFEVWGIEGVAFVDGGEAVAWIEDVDAGRVQTDDLPALAIIDIRIPEVSGPEVAARLRKSPRLKNNGIVLITAYRLQPPEEEVVMAESQADLLYKPLPRPDEFREILEEILAKRKALAGSNGTEAMPEAASEADSEAVLEVEPAPEEADESEAADVAGPPSAIVQDSSESAADKPSA